ncbi:hypothetical protein H0H87_003509 [Tephrocybe sp. NHM501043]|nr:hypothetical protein H0H87_003509 [Tephrocybe sp. NHM501043]
MVVPSQYDIQREVEALRDIRRRSVTPGALTIDLDLPNQSPPSSPTSFRIPSPSDESSSDSASGSGTSGSSEGPPQTPNTNLFGLWVPADVHPEIAPAEFRAFLKEHARLAPSSDDGSGSFARSGSLSSLSSASGLGRKKSMLSRQYEPNENDGEKNEQVVPLRRNRSSFYINQGPQLTFDDLQRLEQLAEEASASDDPSRLREVLRRSLSMNVSPSGTPTHIVYTLLQSHCPPAIGHMDEIPDLGDEADAPIIVPPPGQILRRAARTKIRKPGLPGDGGGHRFGTSRRKPTRAQTAPIEPRSSSDISSSDHGDSVESGVADRRSVPFSDEGSSQRPDSFSEETSIFDAYAREDDDDETHPMAIITSSPPPIQIDLPQEELQPQLEPEPEPEPPSAIEPALLEALGPVIHHPRPQRLLSPQPPAEQLPSRTPSPPEPLSPATAVEKPSLSPQTPSHTPPSFLSTTPSPPPGRKEKDKKGLFSKWGGDKNGRKGKQKDLEKERVAEKEKEKESGFFGSLFGSKKKQDEVPPPLLSPGHAGRETAQALLGAPKSKTPISPGLSSGIGPNNYSRYPIHVERAIYRLSHIKLANPRRPLYEQVLISNLMFWYLGVINKPQSPQSPSTQPQTAQSPTGSAESHNTEDVEAEKERKEREQQEQRERQERERQEKERMEQEREVEMKKKESGRKGSLTKAPAGGRRAEMPVKGPQYEMQHREIQQEYNGYNNGQPQQGGVPINRAASPANGQTQYSRNPQQNNPPKLVQPHATRPGEQFYYSPDLKQKPQQPRLPPGAMSPEQQMWHQQQSDPRKHSPSPPSSPVHSRSRSPPIRSHGRRNANSSQEHLALDNDNEHHRMPGRSLSATAIPVQAQPMSNGKMRKVTSAHAALPGDGRDLNGGANGEEEDIPLAMWQQQRRR